MVNVSETGTDDAAFSEVTAYPVDMLFEEDDEVPVTSPSIASAIEDQIAPLPSDDSASQRDETTNEADSRQEDEDAPVYVLTMSGGEKSTVINNGTIDIEAYDDGINASGNKDGRVEGCLSAADSVNLQAAGTDHCVYNPVGWFAGEYAEKYF